VETIIGKCCFSILCYLTIVVQYFMNSCVNYFCSDIFKIIVVLEKYNKAVEPVVVDERLQLCRRLDV
jgi:hypothetical protein